MPSRIIPAGWIRPGPGAAALAAHVTAQLYAGPGGAQHECILKAPPGRGSARAAGQRAVDAFVEVFAAKYPVVVECLKKDQDVLLTFYDLPAEHWIHLRTTNPIESTFATVRLRHRRTKGNGSCAACPAMVFKLTGSASRKWRLLNGAKLLPEVIAGVRFSDGGRPEKDAA